MSPVDICHWSDCCGCTAAVAAGDPTAARRWATLAVGDAVRAHALRAAAAAAPGLALDHTDDRQLIERLVTAIVGGSLRVCGPARQRQLLALAAQPVAPAPAPAASSAPRRSAAPPPAAAAEPEIDAAAMAQALREASRSGVPFCEECARAAATA